MSLLVPEVYVCWVLVGLDDLVLLADVSLDDVEDAGVCAHEVVVEKLGEVALLLFDLSGSLLFLHSQEIVGTKLRQVLRANVRGYLVAFLEPNVMWVIHTLCERSVFVVHLAVWTIQRPEGLHRLELDVHESLSLGQVVVYLRS